MSRIRHLRGDDRGLSMIVFAATIGTLLMFVALVIDLGQARSKDQVNDAVVDDAALAGAAHIDEGDAEVGCRTAWAYVEANVTASTLDPACTQLAGVCDAGTARTASVDLGDQRYTFTSPVPDDHPFLGDQPVDADVDQDSCQRFAVSVADVSTNFFQEGAIDLASSAVAVQSQSTTTGGGGGQPSSLVLLDPTGCRVLRATGGSELRVLSNEGVPGTIHVDSDGSDCNGSQAVIDVDGKASIDADAVYHVATGENAVSTPESEPPPTWDEPVDEAHTRTPADTTWGAAIDALHDRLATGSDTPDGFRRWTDFIAETRPFLNKPCDINGDTSADGVPRRGSPYPIDVPAGDWHVDCPKGLKLNGDGSVVFRGGEIVMEEPIRPNDIPVAVNCPSGSIPVTTDQDAIIQACGEVHGDSIVVVRDGDLLDATGSHPMVWQRTFGYAPNGTIDVGQNDRWYWTAPLAGDFAGLLFWSESSQDVDYRSPSTENLFEGTFFAPNADMVVTGGAQLESRGGQFLLKSFTISGGSSFTLWPDPDRNVPPDGSTETIPAGVDLIR